MTIRELRQAQIVNGIFGLISRCVIEPNSAMAQLEQAVRAYLIDLINQSGIKQEAIAKLAGKSQSWLSMYKSGARGSHATLDDLDALAGVFDKTLLDVLHAVADERPPVLDKLQHWILLGRALPEAKLDEFLDTVSAYVKVRGGAGARPRRKPRESSE